MSSFIEEMSKFTRDASKSKIYDFEFVAVPGHQDRWHVRYSHKPKNSFSKLFKKIYNPPSVFMISQSYRDGVEGYSADNAIGFEHYGGSPYIDFNEDVHDFFKEIRDWLGVESN